MTYESDDMEDVIQHLNKGALSDDERTRAAAVLVAADDYGTWTRATAYQKVPDPDPGVLKARAAVERACVVLWYEAQRVALMRVDAAIASRTVGMALTVELNAVHARLRGLAEEAE